MQGSQEAAYRIHWQLQILENLNFHFNIIVIDFIHMHESPGMKTIPHYLHLKAALYHLFEN